MFVTDQNIDKGKDKMSWILFVIWVMTTWQIDSYAC